MTESIKTDLASEDEAPAAAPVDADGQADRRKAIGRILTLAAAAPMAALLFKPNSAAAY